jgi:hypothetical protein
MPPTIAFLVGDPLVEPAGGLARQPLDRALQPIAIPRQLAGFPAQRGVPLLQIVDTAILPREDDVCRKREESDNGTECQKLAQRAAVADALQDADDEFQRHQPCLIGADKAYD